MITNRTELFNKVYALKLANLELRNLDIKSLSQKEKELTAKLFGFDITQKKREEALNYTPTLKDVEEALKLKIKIPWYLIFSRPDIEQLVNNYSS